MSTYDRVKSLLTNSSSLNTLNKYNYSNIISESRDKLNGIINKRSCFNFAPSIVNATATIREESDDELYLLDHDVNMDLLKSMNKLTNFVLYDIETTDDGQTVPTLAMCLFDLNEKDVGEIEYFANEIDGIQEELIDLSNSIQAYNESYKRYCEGFLRLCDQKDALFDLFLDYYEEYFLYNKENDETPPPAILNNSNVTNQRDTGRSLIDQQHKIRNETGHHHRSKSKRQRSRRSRSRQHQTQIQQDYNDYRYSNEVNWNQYYSFNNGGYNGNGSTLRHRTKSQQRNNMPQQEPVMHNIPGGRKSSLLVYSIPTENRFSILSRAADGKTHLKHY